MNVDLTITGTVESLHLEPGDRVLVVIEKAIACDQVGLLRDLLVGRFPDNEVLILNGLRIVKVSA